MPLRGLPVVSVPQARRRAVPGLRLSPGQWRGVRVGPLSLLRGTFLGGWRPWEPPGEFQGRHLGPSQRPGEQLVRADSCPLSPNAGPPHTRVLE